jgi:uncharacterized protein DUF3309
MSLGTVFLIVLFLVLIGVLPAWGYSRSWGFGRSGIIGVVVVFLFLLLLMGHF